MHPFISMELAEARHQDDLRRAERSRLAKQARQERRASERQQQPTLRSRLTLARRSAPAPAPTPESELFTPPVRLRIRTETASPGRRTSEPVEHRRSA
ncbi:hypothetical protein [Segeticoccus rhizosphaerae]|uniref:hypothetical protein n=1 Tax=Segeticoccus rhizosphaerae TaxID=1104777 RepID=UPI0010BFDEC4|nr:hypothetical protein [Ornithinicoccus soli]